MSTPRNYQRNCVHALEKARREGKNKALVVMASGLGKTLTAIFDIKRYIKNVNPEARTLVLCHSANILRQTKQVFLNEFGEEFSYGLFNGKEKAKRKTDFLFANLQSMDIHKEEFDPEEFDYVVVDEAHHSPAPTYGRAVTYFKPSFTLGLTATPDRFDGQKLDEFFGEEPVYSKDLFDAVQEGLLSSIDYVVEIDETNRRRIRALIGEDKNITYADIDGLANNNYTANEDVVAKIRERLEKMDDPTTVIFCQTIEHADTIHSLVDGSAVIHSQCDSVANTENIGKLRRGEIKTVITVNMFNEGIDIPRTDVVVFLRVTQSKTIFLQQLGRGLRKADEKEKVTVLDFVGTGARIREIMGMKKEFKERSERRSPDNPQGGPGYGYFNLHLGGREKYEDVEVELVEIILKTQKYAGRNLSSETMLEMLRDLAKQLGHTPSGIEVDAEPDMPSRSTYDNRFGNFSKAITLAGLDIKPVNKRYTDKELLDKLREKATEIGRIPTTFDLSADPDMPSSVTYRNRFGGLMVATEKAGIGKTREAYDLSDEEMLERLRKLGEELGYRPTYEDVKNSPITPSPGCYCNRFGNLSNALDSIELFTPKRQKKEKQKKEEKKEEKKDKPLQLYEMEDDELLKRLREFGAEIGRIPSRRDVDKAPGMASSDTYRKRFGSFSKAILSAGFPRTAKAGRRKKDDH